MGIFSSIQGLQGEQTGFGPNGNPDPHNIDSNAFRYYYDNAKSDLQGIGTGIQTDKVNDALGGQLAGLDNNMAGRKQNFMEDSARGFSADTQNLARSKGGTGGMANAFNNAGSMYDGQARQTSRGLNDLYSQGTKDLATLSGVNNQLYNQQATKQTNLANLEMGMRSSEMGVANQANENTFNSEAAGAARRGNTLSGVMNAAGSFMAGGGIVDQAEKLAPLAMMLLNKGGEAHPIDGEAYAHARAPVPGKAAVSGDSLKNDKVHAMLSPGEGIIPRSVMKSKDAPEKAARFVRDIKNNEKSPHLFVGGEMPDPSMLSGIAGGAGGAEGGGEEAEGEGGGGGNDSPFKKAMGSISKIFSGNAAGDSSMARAPIKQQSWSNIGGKSGYAHGGDVHAQALKLLKKRGA